MNILPLCLICGICSGTVLLFLMRPVKNRRLLTELFSLTCGTYSFLKQVLLPRAGAYRLGFVLFFAFLYLFARALSGRTPKEILRGLAGFLFLNILGDLAALSWLKLSGLARIPDWREAEALAPVLISNLSQLSLAVILSFLQKHQRQKLREEGAFLLLHAALLALCVIACCVSGSVSQTVHTELTALQGIVMLVMIVCYLAWIRQADLRRTKKRLEELRRRNEESFAHYRRLEQSYERLHRLRHDFANLLQTAQAAKEQGNTELAAELFRQAEELLGEIKDEESSGWDPAAAGQRSGSCSLVPERQ